jgi:hypothetical protein
MAAVVLLAAAAVMVRVVEAAVMVRVVEAAMMVRVVEAAVMVRVVEAAPVLVVRPLAAALAPQDFATISWTSFCRSPPFPHAYSMARAVGNRVARKEITCLRY